jgi:nucleotide-binding universal stress UspA family protein
MKNRKLLVVVDESPATRKALEYVAQMVAGRDDFQICLAHSLVAQPPELVEFRGAERSRLSAYKDRWKLSDERTEHRVLKRANAILREGGIEGAAVEAHSCNLVDGTRATRAILELAREKKCDTIVVGRKSLSWLSELIDGNPAEELVNKGKGFTIWVVE